MLWLAREEIFFKIGLLRHNTQIGFHHDIGCAREASTKAVGFSFQLAKGSADWGVEETH